MRRDVRRGCASARARVALHLAQGGAGECIHDHEFLGGHERGQFFGHQGTQARQGGRVGCVAGHHPGGHTLAPLGIVDTGHGHLGHIGVAGQYGLDRIGPHVLAAGDDHVATPALHLQATLRVDGADVVGVQPALGIDGGGAVSVGAHQHRATYQHLTVVGDAQLDPVEGDAVVDDAAAGFGEPVGGGDVCGALCGWAAAAEQDDSEQRRVDAGEGRGYQRHRRHA